MDRWESHTSTRIKCWSTIIEVNTRVTAIFGWEKMNEGRNIFNHIKNAIKYLLACNIGEVIYVIAAVIFQLPIVTALQLLYINLVTDGLPAMALAFSPNNSNIMREKPRRVMTILGKPDFKYIFLVGVVTAVLAFLSFLPSVIFSQPKIAVTLVFTSIIIIQQFILVDIWLSHKSILTHFSLLKKPIFILGFFFPFILHPFIIYHQFFQNAFSVTSLSFWYIILSILISLFIFIPLELFKKIESRRSESNWLPTVYDTVALPDELRRQVLSGRRVSNPQPLPWEGSILPLNYYRLINYTTISISGE